MTGVGEDVEPSYTNGRLAVWYSHLEKQFGRVSND